MGTIGIIGGMGPVATNRLCDLITELTPATFDQQHIPVISFNNSLIPSRVEAIFGGGPSPLPELIRTARTLQSAGADFLIMPCNTAHYYFDEIKAAVDIPFFNMLEETARHLVNIFPKMTRIGLLGSTPTLNSGLYDKFLTEDGKIILHPDATIQSDLVMPSIFGEYGIKAGYREQPRSNLLKAAQSLIESGAEGIIAGCTEISLVLRDGDLSTPVFDPLKIIAEVAVRRALLGTGKLEHFVVAL